MPPPDDDDDATYFLILVIVIFGVCAFLAVAREFRDRCQEMKPTTYQQSAPRLRPYCSAAGL